MRVFTDPLDGSICCSFKENRNPGIHPINPLMEIISICSAESLGYSPGVQQKAQKNLLVFHSKINEVFNCP